MSTPSSAQEWLKRAVEHYEASRTHMTEYGRLTRMNPSGPISSEADRTFRLASNETQAAGAAATIADAMFNETLAITPTTGAPYSFGDER